jgi:multidrug efflux system membrane fusion protein
VLAWILLLLIACALFHLALQYRFNAQTAVQSSATPTTSVPVTVATVNEGTIGVYLEAIGTVTPVYTASITAG